MTDIKRIGDSGIHTVEGNLAGSRAAGLTKQRQAQAQEYEDVKNKIKQQNAVAVGRIDDKFNSGSDILEQEFKKRTIGLVSAEEFRKARSYVDELAQIELEQKLKEESKEKEELKKKDRDASRKKMASSLSFQMDDENEETAVEQTIIPKKAKILKNPDVDTTFLPDRDRDKALEETKERLRSEWLQQQELVKNEMLEVVYSYWDGSGHRKSIQVKKGVSIGRFLELVAKQLAPEFHELRMMTAEGLLYVKEDLIIPHQYTFYDLIVTQARGKSGPLFHFDVHDDIRLVNDARVEKDESHPGKIVERRWYERNKHIFPASRWEAYDPAVQRDRYTIHGGEVNK